MRRIEEITPEVLDLLAAFCDGTTSPAETQRLEELLDSEPDGLQLLLDYLQLDADLQMSVQGERALTAVLGGILPPPDGPALLPEQTGPAASSPVLGFLSNLGEQGWRSMADHALLCSVLAGLVVAVSLAIAVVHGTGRGQHGERVAESDRRPRPARDASVARSVYPRSPATFAPGRAPSLVARLTRVAGCRWNDPAAPAPGDRLRIGQALHLAAGVAEIHFDIGVQVVLQSPAALTVESDKRLRLDLGKATARVLSKAACGFQIVTPEGTFVDQGTEFGVEATRDGSGSIHVFQGAVDVMPNASQGVSLLPHRLRENCGARLDETSRSLTLLEDTGESFIRTMEQSARDRHVVAYWRFEDRPLGVILPDTQENSKPVRATIDSSFNGNDLFVYVPKNRPTFSGSVIAGGVPQTGAVNRGCLDLTAPRGEDTSNREVYTHSQFSHASPIDIQKITPAQWTIEASLMAKQLHRGEQTFVCRDGKPGQRARLIFQINEREQFAISFADVEGRFHEAVAAAVRIEENRWYSLAATSDGRTLRLYVNDHGGHGYRLEAATPLPPSDSTALGNAGDDCDWALGRVRHPPDDIDQWFQGWIDEVRISDVALEPAAFLFSTARGLGNASATVRE